MKAIIKIKTRPWTGWSEKQPKVKEKEFMVAEGDILDQKKLETFFGSSIKILEINKDYIKIRTNGLVLETKKGTIDLFTNTKDLIFTIGSKDSIILQTPTMDNGYTYTIKILKIKKE